MMWLRCYVAVVMGFTSGVLAGFGVVTLPLSIPLGVAAFLLIPSPSAFVGRP